MSQKRSRDSDDVVVYEQTIDPVTGARSVRTRLVSDSDESSSSSEPPTQIMRVDDRPIAKPDARWILQEPRIVRRAEYEEVMGTLPLVDTPTTPMPEEEPSSSSSSENGKVAVSDKESDDAVASDSDSNGDDDDDEPSAQDKSDEESAVQVRVPVRVPVMSTWVVDLNTTPHRERVQRALDVAAADKTRGADGRLHDLLTYLAGQWDMCGPTPGEQLGLARNECPEVKHFYLLNNSSMAFNGLHRLVSRFPQRM